MQRMTAIENYFNNIQECPHCGGLCKREHFGHEPICDDWRLAYLYCDFCRRGREIVLLYRAGRWEVDFWHDVPPDDPKKVETFLKHLEATRCVAA